MRVSNFDHTKNSGEPFRGFPGVCRLQKKRYQVNIFFWFSSNKHDEKFHQRTQVDDRVAIILLREFVETAKNYLYSEQFHRRDKRNVIIGGLRDETLRTQVPNEPALLFGGAVLCVRGREEAG